MALTKDTFRARFPAFGTRNPKATELYPDESIDMWVGIGAQRVSADRFGDMYDHALGLFVAHNLTIEATAVDAGGGFVASGIVQSERVGDVGTTYSNEKVSIDGAGDWNLTTYGRQYIQLCQLYAAGGTVV
jgi:hypothetical protein